MPASQRRRRAGLIQRLLEAPYRFDFHQAVQVLTTYFRQRTLAGSPVAAEPLRFSSSLALGFPASEVEALHITTSASETGVREGELEMLSASLTPSFIGLTGNCGALPRYYSELLANRKSLHRDTAAAAFLDLFTHRAVMQFHRAWLRNRPHCQYEQDPQNHYLPWLLALSGLGSNALRDRLREADGDATGSGIFDESLAYYATTLSNAGKSAHSIGQLLQDYLRVPVTVEPFIGRWFEVPPHQSTALGAARGALGAGALCGSRVWQRETRLRLNMGPLNKAQFDSLLPGGGASRSLVKLLGMLTGVTLEYEVQLSLRCHEAPAPQLTTSKAPRLGLDSWLWTHRPASDLRSASFEVHPQLH